MNERVMGAGTPRRRGVRYWSRLVVQWTLFAALMGIVGGAAAVALSWASDLAGLAYGRFPLLVCLLPAVGVVTYRLYRRLDVDVTTNTSTVIESARRNRSVGFRLAPAIFLGTCMTVLTGGSVGKEAAALQLGGALGSKIGNMLGFNGDFDRFFLLSGMAAALSALLYTPLASAVFVIEVARLRLGQLRYYLPIVVSSFSAWAVARIFHLDVIGRTLALPAWSWRTFLVMMVIAALVAIGGAVFCICLRRLRLLLARLQHGPYIPLIGGGVLIAVVTLAFGLQSCGGPGLGLVYDALGGRGDFATFVWKFVLTLAVLACGFKGGEIMPSFAIGATLGAAIAIAAGVDVPLAAALGLVVMFSSVTNCPLASIILGMELFGVALAPYLVAGSAIAYLIGHRVSLFDNREHLLPREGGRHISVTP